MGNRFAERQKRVEAVKRARHRTKDLSLWRRGGKHDNEQDCAIFVYERYAETLRVNMKPWMHCILKVNRRASLTKGVLVHLMQIILKY